MDPNVKPTARPSTARSAKRLAILFLIAVGVAIAAISCAGTFLDDI